MGKSKCYCKIDGIIYNLKKVQDIIDANPEYLSEEISTALTEEYHIADLTAFLLGEIIEETKEIPTDYDKALKEFQERNRKRRGIPERYSEDSDDDVGNIQRRSADILKHIGDNKYYCRIDGGIYNLKKIQDIIDANPKYLSEEISTALEEEYHIEDLTAFLLGEIIEETKEIPADYNEALEAFQERNRKRLGIPKCFQQTYRCPRCGSTNFSKPIWSLYDYKCGTCGHEWVRCPRCGGSNIKIRRVPPVSAVKNSLNKCKDCGHDWRRI